MENAQKLPGQPADLLLNGMNHPAHGLSPGGGSVTI